MRAEHPSNTASKFDESLPEAAVMDGG